MLDNSLNRVEYTQSTVQTVISQKTEHAHKHTLTKVTTSSYTALVIVF